MLTIAFGHQHVAVRVAVFEVRVIVDHRFERVGAFDVVRSLAPVDDGQHERVIFGTAEAAEDQPRDGGHGGKFSRESWRCHDVFPS
ncbi:hypothetical protein FBQ79_09620 [Anaerolineae bacterium AMX1]|nr:hypothetical protein [Anaerolineae bacterium AMX1]